LTSCSEKTIAPLYKAGIGCFESVLDAVCFYVFHCFAQGWMINQKAFLCLLLYLKSCRKEKERERGGVGEFEGWGFG
jgi:hypothetical protein